MRKPFAAAAAAVSVMVIAFVMMRPASVPAQVALTADMLEKLQRLESSVNQLERSQETLRQEIGQKLNRVLANQERILKELEIVKVRATQR